MVIPQTVHFAAETMPPFHEWVSSSGFAGAAAVLAALIIVLALLVVALRLKKQMEQRERQHQETLDAGQRVAAIRQCWDRLIWVVETADMEPAAADPAGANMGLGPEMAEELLRGLKRDADELGDETLANAVAVYLKQLGLVLTQQTSRLAEVMAAAARPSAGANSAGKVASPAGSASRATATAAASSGSEGRDSAAATAGDGKAEAAAGGEGRRRR